MRKAAVSRDNIQGAIFFLLTLENYAIIIVTGCQGTVSHTLYRKGVVLMTTYETLSFAVAFATLIVLIIKKK
ncbi:hypothetical protein PIPA1_14760 [Pelosinus sp. IPA-1]|nr:hypothetical protein PIPA1_14760 [Pelosinus sp. IPA-1]